MNEDEKAAATLIEVIKLNNRSDQYFWGTVLSTIAMIVSVILAFRIGLHFLFLAGAWWVLARLILMPKGIEFNRQARELLDRILE